MGDKKYIVYKSKEYLPPRPINTKASNTPFNEESLEYRIYIFTKCVESFPGLHSKAYYMKKTIELINEKIKLDHCE